MNHIQISIKFDEDTHDKITQMTGKMRITPHKFIVTAVQEMQRMIEERGKERVPFLVVQARAALDYERESRPCRLILTLGRQSMPAKWKARDAGKAQDEPDAGERKRSGRRADTFLSTSLQPLPNRRCQRST